MGTKKDAFDKLGFLQTFAGTGVIGAPNYPVGAERRLRVVTTGCGVTNAIKVQGRIKQATAYQDLATITGNDTGTTVDISVYDEIRFNCTTYEASGTPTLVASGFFSEAPSVGGSVDSVNGQTGTVVLDTDDVPEGATNKYVSWPALAPAGTALEPSYGFEDEPGIDTGMYWIAAGTIGWSSQGNEAMRLAPGGDLSIQGAFNAQGNLDVGGDTTLNGDLAVIGNISAANYPPPPPTGNANTAAYYDNTNALASWNELARDVTSGGVSVNTPIEPDDGAGMTVHQWTTSFDPQQDSPDENWNIFNINVNLDTNSSGFSQGVNGNAVQILNMGFNHGGTGNVGGLTYVNASSNLGNGTDPITIRSMSGVFVGANFAADATIDGQIYGFITGWNFDAASVGTTNFSVIELQAQSNIQIPMYGYTLINCGVQIAEMSNNSGFTGLNLSPTIPVFDGNAQFNGISITGDLGTFDTGYYAGIYINSSIDSIVNADGLFVDVSNITASGNKYAARFIGNVDIQGDLTFTGSLTIGNLNAFYSESLSDGGGNPDSGNLLVTSPTAAASATIANADYLGLNTACVINIGDNATITTAFLGVAAMGLPAVLNLGTGATIDRVAGGVFALSLQAGAAGTADQVSLCRAIALPNGTTTVNRLYGYEMLMPFGDVGTDAWGLYVIPDIHNWVKGDLRIGGTTLTDDIADSGFKLHVDGDTKLEGDLVHLTGNIGFFAVGPVSQQTGGAQTAGGTYGATEQGMLQTAYDALRAYGLLS